MRRRILLVLVLGTSGSNFISEKRCIPQMALENQESDDDSNTSHTDFEKAFQEGYSFQYNAPNEGLQTVEFSVNPIGELILTTGRLVACDSLIDTDYTYAFTKTLPPGNYPVLLSLAGFKPEGSRKVACAMLQVTRQKPVRWEAAIFGPDLSREYTWYGVDSGTGSFMDLEASRVLKALGEPDPVAYQVAKRESSEAAWGLSMAALDRFEKEFADRVNAEMEKNREAARSSVYSDDRKGDWANLNINDQTQANVITFSSGLGDGGYASYWGYDSDNNIACIVTDFLLFNEDESITKKLV
jgi:Protein of unknown function (DUF4241)